MQSQTSQLLWLSLLPDAISSLLQSCCIQHNPPCPVPSTVPPPAPFIGLGQRAAPVTHELHFNHAYQHRRLFSFAVLSGCPLLHEDFNLPMSWVLTGNMSDVDDTEQLHNERLEEEAVTLAELRDHLRSFVTQLDEAPSEPVILPWTADRRESPEEEGHSPSSHRGQTPGSESAAFATGTGFTQASKKHCDLHDTKICSTVTFCQNGTVTAGRCTLVSLHAHMQCTKLSLCTLWGTRSGSMAGSLIIAKP